jgi:S1-C subfamily serine protease
MRQGGQKTRVEVTLAKLHVPGKKIVSSLGARPFFRGLRVDFASLLVQQGSGARYLPKGVLITEIQPDSAAAAAHVKQGEIISHVNGEAVNNPAAFYQAVRDAKREVELTIAPLQEAPVKVILK